MRHYPHVKGIIIAFIQAEMRVESLILNTAQRPLVLSNVPISKQYIENYNHVQVLQSESKSFQII